MLDSNISFWPSIGTLTRANKVFKIVTNVGIVHYADRTKV